jgi:hypothetical protein
MRYTGLEHVDINKTYDGFVLSIGCSQTIKSVCLLRYFIATKKRQLSIKHYVAQLFFSSLTY